MKKLYIIIFIVSFIPIIISLIYSVWHMIIGIDTGKCQFLTVSVRTVINGIVFKFRHRAFVFISPYKYLIPVGILCNIAYCIIFCNRFALYKCIGRLVIIVSCEPCQCFKLDCGSTALYFICSCWKRYYNKYGCSWRYNGPSI